MGVISAVGSTVDSFWSNILAGRHGISPIEGFDTSGLPVKLAAEVKDFDASASVSYTHLDVYKKMCIRDSSVC